MTQQSSAELDPVDATAAEMPLSERPLVAAEDNTVVASATENPPDTGMEIALTATAQEIRDRLFGSADTSDVIEQGLRIGHFEIQERIGTGGMGAVFRAIDTTLSRPVALKVLYPGTSGDPSLVARFRQEARAAAQLNHDNIARVFFSDELDGIHFIAYEFADGLNLKQLITSKGGLSVEETINYAIQATLALNHISSSGIVHRDIKPSNIIVTRQGRVKVVDLGLARRDTQDSIGDLTVAGTTLGTFDYISPEQARDPSSADIRSDIYSLGCTIYHMLTGQPPYPEGTALQKLLDHQGKTPPDPRKLVADVPAGVAFVVQKMMNTDPTLRYQDPGQLLSDLISVATQLGLRTVPAEGVVWRRIPVKQIRQLSGSLFLTASIFTICATALAMFFLPQPLANDQVPAALMPAGLSTESSITQDPDDLNPDGDPDDAETITAEDNSVVPPPIETSGVFGLRSADTDVLEYFDTFREAWGRAETGDVIILDFDGLPAEVITELPQSPDSRRIEIRAAENRQPTLRFRVDAADSDGGRLFRLKNNLSLSLFNVNLKVELGDEVFDEQTALFDCIGHNRISLRNCAVTVENPQRHRMAIVQLTDAVVDSPTASAASFSLMNVAVRGCCDVVLNNSLTPLRIEATESAFLLDGSIVYHRGSNDMTRTPGQTGVILNRTSSILARPAIRMEDSDGLTNDSPERTLPELSVTADSNVFLSLTPNGTLVQSRGNVHVEELEELFRWNGSHNLYYNFLAFWQLNSGLDADRPPRTFEEWIEHWSLMTATAEEAAAELPEDVLKHPTNLMDRSRGEILEIPVETLELKRTPFYGDERYPELETDNTDSIPGVPQPLPTFQA